MKLYVASSWRNPYQPDVVQRLREMGHAVYDFRNPAPGDSGFSWRELDPRWEQWTPNEWREALEHPIARAGFQADFAGMEWADACLLVLPSGRSSHLEAGYMAGQKKPVGMFVPAEHPDRIEPDLMVRLFHAGSFLTDWRDVEEWLRHADDRWPTDSQLLRDALQRIIKGVLPNRPDRLREWAESRLAELEVGA